MSSFTSRIERMFGRIPPPAPTPPTPAPLPAPAAASGPFLMPMSPPPTYQQWYDRDPELLETERQSLDAKGFKADCTMLPDAKACFAVTIAGRRAALICGYAHPIEPVTVHMLEDVDSPTVVDELGKVDLFAHDGFLWSVDTRLGDVAQRVATLLSVAGSKVSGPKRIPDSCEHDGTDHREPVGDEPQRQVQPTERASSAKSRQRVRSGGDST